MKDKVSRIEEIRQDDIARTYVAGQDTMKVYILCGYINDLLAEVDRLNAEIDKEKNHGD